MIIKARKVQPKELELLTKEIAAARQREDWTRVHKLFVEENRLRQEIIRKQGREEKFRAKREAREAKFFVRPRGLSVSGEENLLA